MPSLLRIVVAEAGRGVDFVTVGIAIRERLPKHGEIIFHPHQQHIPESPRDACDIKFKRLEKSLMRAEADAVQIDLAAVIHRIEAKHLPLLGKHFRRQVEHRSIQGGRRTKWGAVMRNPHILPHADAALHGFEIRAVRGGFHAPLELGNIQNPALGSKRRCEVRQEGRHPRAQRRQFGAQFLRRGDFSRAPHRISQAPGAQRQQIHRLRSSLGMHEVGMPI